MAFEKVVTLSQIPKGFKIVSDSLKISSDMKEVTYVAYAGNTQQIICVNNKTSPVYYAVQAGSPIVNLLNNRKAYIAYKNKGEAVIVVDGQPIATLGNADNLQFSPDGSRYACRAQKDENFFAVVDGIQGNRYKGIIIKNNFKFSPDSKHFIYVALKNDQCVLVYDGQEEKNSFYLIQDVVFTPDSSRYVYKAKTNKSGLDINEKWCVVDDGNPGAVYDKIFDLIFSPDSEHLAYVAIKDRQMILIVDGKELATHDRVGIPLFSSDSKRFTYAFQKKNKWYIVIDENQSPSYEQVYKLVFSPDLKRFSYTAKKKGKWFCIVDGKEGPGFEKGIDGFRFSPDSSRYAYIGVNNDDVTVITDGVPGCDYQSIGELYFSPNSKHIVYRAFKLMTQKWWTILDGKEYFNAYYGIRQYHFSSDSKHLAFHAFKSTDQTVMVVDRKEQCASHNFKILGDPYFSPDGNHIAYYARAGNENWKLVIDGHVLPGSYGGFIKGTLLMFDSPRHFHTIGIQKGGREFLLIEVDIPENIKLETELPLP